MQVDCFSHIQNDIFVIPHDIHSRLAGELF